MSTQKGNTNRTRPQKYQNTTKFKNNLHDTSHNTKFINSLAIDNVCARCKNIIEWKIKYKKYKPLKSPTTCVKCHNKNVKQAYHTMCTQCSKEMKVCPKCGQQKELIESTTTDIQKLLKLPQVEEAVKSLSERRRRTFHRQMNNPECDLNTEEKILNRLNELSIGRKKNEFDDDDFDFDDEDDISDPDGEDF
ncbi:hypothetical protein RUM43_005565 [Polyplax serrata]|uniref:Uncharacterized protein n=1 Tax=Polyplax serrata TaxID=468196 RepID=A0AAN8RUS3_POLSC